MESTTVGLFNVALTIPAFIPDGDDGAAIWTWTCSTLEGVV